MLNINAKLQLCLRKTFSGWTVGICYVSHFKADLQFSSFTYNWQRQVVPRNRIGATRRLFVFNITRHTQTEMPQSTAVRDAPPPFSGQDANRETATDLILRSSDRVDFHTHKVILAFVSPVFRDMFSFPTPSVVGSEDFKDGKPVVQLSEPSIALHKLLVVCYPQAVTKEMFANLDGACLAYHAADKYQIPGAKDAILKILPTFVQADPYRMYAIACHLGLAPVAASAAAETLKDYFLPREIVAPEFDLISGSKLLLLHKLHSARSGTGRKVYAFRSGSRPWPGIRPRFSRCSMVDVHGTRQQVWSLILYIGRVRGAGYCLCVSGTVVHRPPGECCRCAEVQAQWRTCSKSRLGL